MPFSGSGQLNPEAAARTGSRFDANAATHSLDAFAHDGQADARARIRVRAVKPFEHSKNAFMIFGLDADTVVFNPQPHKFAIEC